MTMKRKPAPVITLKMIANWAWERSLPYDQVREIMSRHGFSPVQCWDNCERLILKVDREYNDWCRELEGGPVVGPDLTAEVIESPSKYTLVEVRHANSNWCDGCTPDNCHGCTSKG